MPRSRRNIPPDSILHVINRGNDRRTLFRDASEYEEFLGLLRHAAGREPLRLLGYVLMPNHWHLVVWPESGTQLSRYLHLVATVHAARWRRRVGRTGEGHVYQDRYHAFMIESERQFFNVLRYVEANPIRAGLVTRSVEWPWSSLAERLVGPAGLLTPSPVPAAARLAGPGGARPPLAGACRSARAHPSCPADGLGAVAAAGSLMRMNPLQELLAIVVGVENATDRGVTVPVPVTKGDTWAAMARKRWRRASGPCARTRSRSRRTFPTTSTTSAPRRA